MSARQQFIEASKKAMQEGNIAGACNSMVNVVKDNANLSHEERLMLYGAYKGAAGKFRHDLKKNPQDANAARELQQYCGELINILSQYLIPAAADTEAKVFYYKVMGDFYRYYDEVAPTQQNKQAAEQSYQTASDWAASGLAPTHPLRLNVALNYGVLYQETLRNGPRGLEVTRSAIDNARAALVGLQDAQKADASSVLWMLYDNAEEWSKELGQPAPAPIQGIIPKETLFAPPPGAQQGGHPGHQ